MLPLVSIIIPVYNSQLYIQECLESMKNQDYPNFEVVIVNDGSTDNSKDIINQFINDNNLSNFILINTENGGVSRARNVGISRAQGEWITFVDSDDWIEVTYISEIMSVVSKYDVDFALAGFRAYELSEDRYDVWTDFTVEYGKMPEDMKYLTSFDYVCGRFYKRELIEKNDIRFDERIRFCEDNAFNYDYISVVDSFACSNKMGYNYRRGHSSAVSRSMVNPHMRKHLGDHMRNFCKNIPKSVLEEALKENKSLSRVLWNATITDIVVDILENNINDAKMKKSQALASCVVNAYAPTSRKDKVILSLWHKPFFVFKFFVKIFYGNIGVIKKFKKFAHFLTH